MLERQPVGAHDVLEVDAPVQQLVDLEVRVVVAGPDLVAVVGLWEEARGAQDQARQSMVSMDELAQVLRRGLRRAVDVAGDRRDVLGDPRRRRARRRGERPPERARGAGEHEAPDAGRHRLLEQGERPAHVRVDERLPAVGADVGLVQGRGVQDRVGVPHALAHARALGDRAHDGGERRLEHVEPDDVVPLGAQDADERLAEVPGAAGDEDPHAHPGLARRLTR